MQELRPARHQLLSTLVHNRDVSSDNLPVRQPGDQFLPALLDPAEALVDNIKLMQVRFPMLGSARWTNGGRNDV